MTGRAHFFVALLTVAMLVFIVRLVRHRRLRAKYAMLWISVGLGLAVLAAFPGLLEAISDRVGVFYPPAVLLLAAVAFLLIIVIHFSWELSRLEDRSRIQAEELAMLRARLDRSEHLGQNGGYTATSGRDLPEDHDNG